MLIEVTLKVTGKLVEAGHEHQSLDSQSSAHSIQLNKYYTKQLPLWLVPCLPTSKLIPANQRSGNQGSPVPRGPLCKVSTNQKTKRSHTPIAIPSEEDESETFPLFSPQQEK